MLNELKATNVVPLGIGLTRLSSRLVGFIALAVLAAGCGSGTETPEASTPAANASPSSPTASASPTPSPKPKPWEVKSKAGAEAFGEYWVDAFYEAQSTGDTRAFVALGPMCELCIDVARQISDVYEAGGSIRSTKYRVVGSKVQKRSNAEQVGLLVAYTSGPVTWRYGDGREPGRFPGGEVNRLVYLAWESGEWRVTDMFDVR